MKTGWGSVLSLVLLAGCVSVDKPNAPPGATVLSENKAVSWLPAGLNGERAGVHGLTRLRIHAPPGTTQCRSRNLFSFEPSVPNNYGRPARDGSVMLTASGEEVTIVCQTPKGEMRRTVKQQRYRIGMRPGEPPWLVEGDTTGAFHYWTLPPLVHMDPRDPALPERWALLAKEICPAAPGSGINMNMCAPGLLDRLRAVDAAG